MAELKSNAVLAKIRNELKKIQIEGGTENIIENIAIILPESEKQNVPIESATKTAIIDLSGLSTGGSGEGEANVIEDIVVKLPGQVQDQQADISNKIATIDLSKINANQVYYVSGSVDSNSNWIGELEGVEKYWDGMVIFYHAPSDNQTNATLKINNMDAIEIVQYAANLTEGAYPKDSIIPLMYKSKLNKLRQTPVWAVLEDNMETATSVSAIDIDWLNTQLK